MLRLKHEPERGFDIASARHKYQRQIRSRELALMFQTIRHSLLEEESRQGLPTAQLMPQLPDNYYQYLDSLLRSPLLVPQLPQLLHPQPQQPLALPPCSPVQTRHQEVIIHKNGVRVFRSLLGSGSYSRVWEGELESGERVAVKEVKRLQAAEEQCLRELRSEHVIRVIDIFAHAGKSFIVLELCDHSLRQELELIQYEVSGVLRYFEQLVAGMQALQERAVVHRDLKFENILIRRGVLKIADFGCAKFLGDQLEVDSRRCGTPYTMAPEVYFGARRTAYSAKSDIWALGVILHEMLYQLHPFGCSMAQLERQRRVPLAHKFGILDRIINRCLVFDPRDRADWEEFMRLFRIYKQKKEQNGVTAYSGQDTLVESIIVKVPAMNEPGTLRTSEAAAVVYQEAEREIKQVEDRPFLKKKQRFFEYCKEEELIQERKWILRPKIGKEKKEIVPQINKKFKFEQKRRAPALRPSPPTQKAQQITAIRKKPNSQPDQDPKNLSQPYVLQGLNHFKAFQFERKATPSVNHSNIFNLRMIVQTSTIAAVLLMLGFLAFI